MRGLKPPPPSVSSIPTLSQRTRRMGHPDYWLSEESNLRGGEGAEDEVGDVADDGLVAVARVGGELFPVGMVAEGIPAGVVLVEAGEAAHVGGAGHAGADEGVAKEDGMRSEEQTSELQ